MAPSITGSGPPGGTSRTLHPFTTSDKISVDPFFMCRLGLGEDGATERLGMVAALGPSTDIVHPPSAPQTTAIAAIAANVLI